MDLKRRRAEDAFSQADPALAGQGAQTIFRDKQGRKLDVVGEAKRKAREDEERAAAEAEAKYDWGTGRVQKDLKLEREEEERKAAAAPFARYRDDAELDERLRSELRDGDPMADLLREKAERKARKAAKKLAKLVSEGKADAAAAASTLAVLKPVYKGSAPANRFGIRPGYRWDGVDRGSGWENKVLSATRSAPFSR